MFASPSTSLPQGLVLDPATGAITGTPNLAGDYYVNITLDDNTSGQQQVETFAITISTAAGDGDGAGDGAGGGEEGAATACYIATAAYGSDLNGNVQVLRDFRDEYLLTNAPGRALVGLYYRTSPPVADFIAQRPALRLAVRATLTPVVYAVKFPLASGLLSVALVFGAAGAFRARRRRTMKH